MDPISLSFLLVSTGLTIFGGIKQNQAAKASGQQAIQKQAEENLLAKYQNELAEVAKKTALAVETARLQELQRHRQQLYVQFQIVGAILLASVSVLLLVRKIREQ